MKKKRVPKCYCVECVEEMIEYLEGFVEGTTVKEAISVLGSIRDFAEKKDFLRDGKKKRKKK